MTHAAQGDDYVAAQLLISTPQSNLASAVNAIAQDAAKEVLPQVETALEQFVIREIAKKSQAVPEVPDGPDINLSDVMHKQQARTSAFKSLVSGLGLAVAAGASTGIAAATGLDWFTKEGAIASGTLVLAAIWHSVQTYLSSLKVTAGT